MIAAVDVAWDVAVVAVAAALACLAGALRMRAISRRARATAAALQVGEARYRQLAAHLPDVTVMLVDRDLRFTLVEGGAIRRHGWDTAELVGRRLEEVLPPDRYAEMEPWCRAALAGETATFEWRGVRADAVYSAQIVPLRDDTGAVTGGMLLATDVTERTRAELRLRESEAMHRSVVDSVGDVVFQTDLEGRWTFLNRAWETYSGRTAAESLGRHVHEIVHPEDRPAHGRAFAPLLTGEVDRVAHVHRFLARGGAVGYASVRAHVVRDAAGRPEGVAGVMTDVTARRRAERRTAAERDVGAVLGGALTLADAAPALLETLCERLEWRVAELWLSYDDGLLLREAVRAPDDATGFAGGDPEPGDGLVARACAHRRVEWSEDLGREQGEPRAAAAGAAGLRGAVAVPVLAGLQCLAVLLLCAREPRERDPGAQHTLENVAGQLARFVEREAAERRVARQASDLAALAAVAQQLAAETDEAAARRTVVEAAQRIAGASSVLLWEPDPWGGTLVATAAVGVAVPPGLSLPVDGTRSGVARAHASGHGAFVTDVADDEALQRDVIELTGAASALWQPVLNDGRSVGVLLVVWRARQVERAGLRDLMTLLAAEAAVTLGRAVLLEQLRTTARTDALTGLPNRRAWDEELEREVARAKRYGGRLCLAMIDLDHFKRFNDREGHQAGDRLLAETAVAWRGQLRPSDLLARYGGEEFALLLPHVDAAAAAGVLSRLLDQVPRGQTASAGLAEWDGGEPGGTLVRRADDALYEAKRSGRARTVQA
jgi:diguanylate cyclase (GGDEF)-like protein/PAS domain S-box-containing protein